MMSDDKRNAFLKVTDAVGLIALVVLIAISAMYGMAV